MAEILFAIGMIALGVAPWAIMGFGGGIWSWLITMFIIMLVVIGSEIYNKIKHGKTISSQFWDWSVARDEFGKYVNVRKAIWILVCYLASHVLLVGHLAARMIKVLMVNG